MGDNLFNQVESDLHKKNFLFIFFKIFYVLSGD